MLTRRQVKPTALIKMKFIIVPTDGVPAFIVPIVPGSSCTNKLETPEVVPIIVVTNNVAMKNKIMISGAKRKILANSELLFLYSFINMTTIPLIRKDTAVLNFIVTHVGTMLFRVSISINHPIMTTRPMTITVADKIRVISEYNLVSSSRVRTQIVILH